MSQKQNNRLAAARRKRDVKIRAQFAHLLCDKGLRYQVVMDLISDEFALSESTISQIINNYGHYNPNPNPNPNHRTNGNT